MNGPVNIVQPGLINQTFQSTYPLSKQNAKWQNECNSFAKQKQKNRYRIYSNNYKVNSPTLELGT